MELSSHQLIIFLFWLLLDGLAVYRLTRLVTVDTITDPWRSWLTGAFTGWLIELLVCGWCLSVWIAAGVVVLTWLFPLQWAWVALALAASAIAGQLLHREDR